MTTPQEQVDLVDARLRGALALSQQGQLVPALRVADEVLRDHPGHQVALLVSGTVLLQMRRFEEAFYRGRQLDPERYLASALLMETHALLGLKRLGEARSSALEWERVCPGELDPLLALARIASAAGEWNEAEAAAERARSCAPDSRAALRLLAKAQLANGKRSAARWTVRRLREVAPNDAEARDLWKQVRFVRG